MRLLLPLVALWFLAGFLAGGDPAFPKILAAPVESAPVDPDVAKLEVKVDALRDQLAREREAHAREKSSIVRALGGDQVDAALRVAHAATGVPLHELRRVAHCESRFKPWATNGQFVGLFQLGRNFRANSLIATAGVSPMNPYANALAAAFVADKQGWRQWECSPRGPFRR